MQSLLFWSKYGLMFGVEEKIVFGFPLPGGSLLSFPFWIGRYPHHHDQNFACSPAFFSHLRKKIWPVISAIQKAYLDDFFDPEIFSKHFLMHFQYQIFQKSQKFSKMAVARPFYSRFHFWLYENVNSRTILVVCRLLPLPLAKICM